MKKTKHQFCIRISSIALVILFSCTAVFSQTKQTSDEVSPEVSNSQKSVEYFNQSTDSKGLENQLDQSRFSNSNDKLLLGDLDNKPITFSHSANSANIFPNPAKNLLRVVCQLKGQFELLNMKGQVLIIRKVQQGLNFVSLNNIRPGNYVVRIKTFAGEQRILLSIVK